MIELFDYQKRALDKLRSGSVLVGGVGSGKSITSLAYFYNKVCMGDYTNLSIPMAKPRDLYIITTARKRDTMEWNGECARFGLSTNPQFSNCGIKVTIDSWNNLHKYTGIKNAFFIFDEQRVVGCGKWYKSFLKVAKVNEWILLSATPGDTWIDYAPIFIANGYYRNRTHFINQHVVYDPFVKYPKVKSYLGVSKLEVIRRRVLVIMDSETTNERHVVDVKVGYATDIYSEVVKTRWDPYDDIPVRDAGHLCRILRRIVNSDVSRIEAVADILSKNNRVIVFYNYNYELEALRSMAQTLDADISVAEWNGQKHEPLPKTKKWIYIVQYTAGAEGWNCTDTNVIIFYSMNYSYKIMEQAAGRIDRVNNHYHDLYYYRLISTSSIDSGIYKALRCKKNFNEKAFVRK